MTGKMRLRDRMTLWYSALTLLALGAFACAAYFIPARVLEEMQQRQARLSLTQLIAQIENENGLLTFENEVPIASDSMYFIMEENGSELASYGSDITLFDGVPLQPDVFRSVQGPKERWLLLDSGLVTVDGFTLRVRVASSCARFDSVLAVLRLVFLTGVPLALLFAVLGGRLIADQALRPVDRIIRTAESIAGGDLSSRIPAAPARDELGELTDTLNAMLSSVEAAFRREQRFASDASHELRTPVAVLRAGAESLLAEPVGKEDRDALLHTMLAECGRMQKIIGQLLTLTRGQEGRYPVRLERLALLPLLEGVRDTLSDRMQEKGITLTLRADPGLTLTADQSLLTELVMNLTENAVKYGRPGGQITLAADGRNGDVILTVADDGIGIPADALPHVFERFYRADAARDRTGTGLGLSICQWIAGVHHGSLTAESREGEGSVFTLRLPAGSTAAG